MQPIRTTTALVLSRVRHDWRRHLAALTAVAVLMATFLTFNGLATGLDEGLRDALADGRHHQVQVTLAGLGSQGMDDATFQDLASSPGVVQASARSARSVGLETEGPPGGPMRNVSFEVLLLGIDAAVEEALVVAGQPGAEVPSAFTRGGYQARNHTLLEGTWIQGPGQAVATQGAAQAGYGVGARVPTPQGDYTVVGIVASAPPITVPGVVPAGHILVDRAGHDWPTVGGAYFELEPDFERIRSFAERLVAQYPAATGALRADVAELERQHFEAARTQQVLSAAGRLVGLAGAATVFAMSLFLLMGERKALGTMAAVGFTRGRLASYMNQKMALLAVLGALAGGVLGGLVVATVPAPALSVPATAELDAATVGLASLQTLAAAIAGSLLALLLTIRKDPIQALRVVE